MFKISDLTVVYNVASEQKNYAIRNVNLTLPDSGFIGLVGPSGSGKSTLMYCLSTLKEATNGDVIYNGKSFRELNNAQREELRREEFGFIFQRHFLVSYMTAIDNVAVVSTSDKKQATEKAREILLLLGIKQEELNKRPSQLSGGQRQRIAIARAMINNPKVLFCDEPTASVDHDTAFVLMDILKEYSKTALVLIITHDMTILKDSDEIVKMWDGEISTQVEGAK